MRTSDFKPPAAGRVIRILEGHDAFIPAPLPPPLRLDPATLLRLSAADRTLGQLAGVGEMLPNPDLMIGPFLRREAVLSSRIEGTISTPEELLLFEARPVAEPKPTDVREVANYVAALDHGLKRLENLPLSLRLIREMHSKLLEGVRGEDERPGEFRNRQNYIADRGQPIEQARYVPPPVPEMHRALDEFERYLNTRGELPPLIQIALLHYQFDAIHPFTDGNGRIGRLLISLLLIERGCLSKPLLYLSAYFERNRSAYFDHLLRVSQAGAWTDWICFFLDGVAQQAQDAIKRARLLLGLWQDYRRNLQKARASALLLRLVDELFANPALTASRARKILHVTHRSAQHNINRLVDAGILREVPGRARNRIYLAPGILSLIELENA